MDGYLMQDSMKKDGEERKKEGEERWTLVI